MQTKLLQRDEFREKVFARDKAKCVCCAKPAVDAHHIVERRLFPDGGYYLDNGVSLCAEHHLLAEKTLLSCESVRAAAGIEKVVLPPSLSPENDYDKWGNIVLKDGFRIPGPLYWEDSVQTLLTNAGLETSFQTRVKHPRTPHLPWSPGNTSDDVVWETTSPFEGEEVVVTEKMDGGNITMSRDYIHARSLDSGSHPTRAWVTGLWGQIRYEIPPGYRICGENLWAVHSIKYENLASYFYVHSIWNERNECLSWPETEEWCALLNLHTVPVLYQGLYSESALEGLWDPSMHEKREGYVVRRRAGFPYNEFSKNVAKFVRPNHVGTSEHWMKRFEHETNQLE